MLHVLCIGFDTNNFNQIEQDNFNDVIYEINRQYALAQ